MVCVILLYLFAIMPTIRRKPGYAGLQGYYYAHRGLHNNKSPAPENSLTAMAKAVEAGYGIELDIQLTKDDQVVVFHDDGTKRACGVKGWVRDYTYEELQAFSLFGTDERIPLFSAVLELVAGRVPLIVEYKINEAAPDFAVCAVGDALLREYSGPYCIESFHPLAVRWYRKNRPAVIRGQLAYRYTNDKNRRQFKYFALQNLMLNFLTRPDFIAFDHNYAGMWSRRICRRLFGCPAVAWTVMYEEQMEKAKRNFDLIIFEGFLP
jgi:glycerophosphoryl diester phosphodiesterase